MNHIKNIVGIIRMRVYYLVLFLAILHGKDSYSQIKNEDDLKKQAEQSFEAEDYNLSYKLYSQLVSLYPKDAVYNYKLGVSMLFTEPNKKKPYSYLQIACKNQNDAPKEALFYLAKAYHLNYKFDDAIKLYNDYKKVASSSSIKKLQVDREIQACKNGKQLLSTLSDLIILSKKQLNEVDYFKAYDVTDIGGKLLVKPDEYKSSYDKKQKDKSVVYLSNNGNKLYFSSYGDGGNNGRDIYFTYRLPNGSWSKAQALPATINTEFDEDYPFLHPNGNTLYFSSKGHNSMGGYDIFKTTYDAKNQTWSKPQNLEFPINSPGDDILFVTDSAENTAFFSTNRYSPYGKLDVLKVNTERQTINFAVINGSVLKEAPTQSVKSKITVKNLANGEIVGIFDALENGDYTIDLPNGGKFIFTVETPGITTQSEAIEIPSSNSLKPFKQTISYENGILKITNSFGVTNSDENYAMMLNLIEKKAKLEINKNEETSDSSNTISSTINSVSTTNPTIQPNTSNNENKTVTNEELIAIAKNDAKEAFDEAAKLKQEAQDAFGLATQKRTEAENYQKEADDIITKANLITDVSKKNEELTRSAKLKEDADNADNISKIALNLAKKLEVDANVQQQEADLTSQYINQLEAITKNKNNTEALKKLNEIQKQLDNLSTQKNQSDIAYTSLKAESELKQQEITNSEKKSKTIKDEINAIKNEVTELQKDFTNEKDKTVKDNITAQIKELNNEVESKNGELNINEIKIKSLNNEINTINQELLIAAKILNQPTNEITLSNNNSSTSTNTIALNTNTEIKTNPTQNTNSTSTITSTISQTDNTSLTNTLALNPNTATNTNSTNVTVSNLSKSDNVKTIQTPEQNEKELNVLANLKDNIKTNFTTTPEIKINTLFKSENTPVDIKEGIQQKFEIIKQNEIALNSLIAATETSFKNNALQNSVLLNNEAEELNTKAYEIRKNINTKPQEERDSLIKIANNYENIAIIKKIDAANYSQNKNKADFEINTYNLAELKIITGEKTSDEISQANMLISEAEINFKQAQTIRIEANSYPNGLGKLGKLGSAEEKENEALEKQKTAINILNKINPTFKTTSITNISIDQATSTINQQLNKLNASQIDAFTTLSNANKNEVKKQNENLTTYLSTKNANKQLLDLKANSDKLLKEAEQLNTQAALTKTTSIKANLLSKVNEKEIAALNLLYEASQFVSANSDVAKNNINIQPNDNSKTENNTNPTDNLNITNNTQANNNKQNTASTTTKIKNDKPVNSSSNLVEIKIDGLEVKNTNVYSDEKPIAIDPKMPDGLIFKVQIGAFRNRLPNTTFKGLTPIIAQTTTSGYYRYMAGDFIEYKNADAVKNDLRNLGYKDAFVVAYYNGIRINLNEATEKAKAAGQIIEPSNSSSAGITANSNVPTNTSISQINNTTTNLVNANSTLTSSSAITSSELEKINGLLFTIQIGVLSSQTSGSQLFNLTPIYSEKLPNGLYRYTAGIYNQPNKALLDKQKVVELGIKDAFVSAYYNSKRIGFSEGQKLITENNNLKLEAENPIVFPKAETTATIKTVTQTSQNSSSSETPTIIIPTTDEPTVTFIELDMSTIEEPIKMPTKKNKPKSNSTKEKTTSTNSVIEVDLNLNEEPSKPKAEAFSNGVKQSPTPTATNGVKSDETGISFKVQIGAFKNKVPDDVALKFLNIKTWPIKHQVVNDLFIYTIGNFNALEYAVKLKEEAVSYGILDAYITVYKDGKKLYGAEASQYLTK